MATGAVITDDGKKIALNRTFKSTPDYTVPSTFKVGIGTTTPSTADTGLQTPVPLTGTEAVDACDATTGWSAMTDTTVALNNSIFIEGTGSLSIAKTGTAGTSFGTYKTTTSRDFTSKAIWVYAYITDITDLVSTGTAITVRFGSDSSNYYYYNVNISSLANGGNWITFTSATATGTTGSPVIAACDYTQVIFNTDLAADTVAANRILVDDIKVASTDDYLGTFVTGYPVLDETSGTMTTRLYLPTGIANGYNITEVGLYNTDGTPKLYNHDVTSAISKSSTEEIIYIIRDTLEVN